MPMPHAVVTALSLDRSRPSASKHAARLPDVDRRFPTRPTPSGPATSLTPPTDMNMSTSLSAMAAGYNLPRAADLPSSYRPPYPQSAPPQHPHPSSSSSLLPSAHTLLHPGRPASPPIHRQPPVSSLNMSGSVAPSLQVPRTISTPQASLPQLAAEVTCLFWFEESSVLRRIEDARLANEPASPLVSHATPSTGFRKWVATILSTTQVTQNVILLALLFIYRLKDINPRVKGKPGSEFRLFTVALMLGNKFLDDNTYTNKTWAEVSGISVQEVHIMEVEFLSNMRYSLFTSEEQWKNWHVKLGKFGTHYERAMRAADAAARSGNLLTPTLQMPSALPSPPTSNHASPPYLSSFSPSYLTKSNTPLLLPQLNSAAVSPIGPLPELDPRARARKRSFDDQVEEPVAKRQMREESHQLPQLPPIGNSTRLAQPVPTSTYPRLPLPNLSIPAQSNSSVPVQLAPPLGPGNRAMSLVYPAPTPWSQPQTQPMSTATLPPSMHTLTGGPLSDISRQLSPYPGGSANASPMSATYHSPHGQNHSRLSPSYFLQQRNSPYRPVRSVNTLLYPPPSATVQYAPRAVAYDRMQYQPLGRPTNERRVGHLPYMHHDAWPTTHQYNQYPGFSRN
ncbi:hypothetical protein K402DRAFT_414554 [Aulographum hederae CBS 113979]|uniref:Cyclin-domain-containing protein n=1 Tax=Aulographum hederae CBS 113979 TaxID=1176131 RepID=A0A6G1GQU2_9PEZI|nr:hypothetical protein K402DRAFT_414554 [Aulographum hederae CBS 113979]